MYQQIESNHFTDSDGNPAGGSTYGTGFAIAWQHGPLGRGEDRQPPNGAFVEGVISAAIDRIEFYQRASEGRFNCAENDEAIRHLADAIKALERRTADREAREVEGTHTA